MSSLDEDKVSAPEATLGQEGKEHLEDPLISLGVAEGSSLMKGPLKMGEGEGGLPETDSCEEEPWPKSEATKEGEGLLSEPEGRAASPVDQEDIGMDFLPQLSIEATAIMRELSNVQTRRVSRYLSPQTCAAELDARWGSVDAGSSRGGQALSSAEGKQVSASPLYPRGLGRNRAFWAANMSSPDDMSVRGGGFGPESGEHMEGRHFSHGFPRGHPFGSDERLFQSREEKMCFPVSKTFQYDSWLDSDEMEGRSVIWGCEGRPCTPVDERGDSLDFAPQLTVEGTSFGQYVANLEVWGVRRHPSARRCASDPFGIWGDTDTGTSKRGLRPPTSMEGKQLSVSQPHSRGLGRGRAWVAPRRGVTSRMLSSESIQCPSSYSTSCDEASETQMMRVTVSLREGGQGKSSGLTELEVTGRHTTVHGRESFVRVPPSVLSSATRTLSSSMEKQASGELKGSLTKKKQSVVWGKEGSRHSIPGTAASSATAISAVVPAPAATAPGAIPKTSPRKKAAQEKPQKQAIEKSLLDPSRGPLGRTFPPWGQRLKSAPVEPASFPPISGVALLGKGSKCSLLSGPKECKPFCTGKKSLAKKTKESQPGAKEDDDSTRDSGLQAQLPTRRAEQPCMFMHRGEMSSGDLNFRASQVPGSSQVLRQRSARLRAPASAVSAEQDPTVDPLLPVGESQPELVQGTPGCPRCLMLQKEIEELKEQLAFMQALNEKFEAL